MSWESVLKLAAVAAGVMVALQLVFYIVFEVIGYDTSFIIIGCSMDAIAAAASITVSIHFV